MLEDKKIDYDEYEQLKSGDPDIFQKVINDNPNLRKLLINTHNFEVKEGERKKILDELNSYNHHKKILNVNNMQKIEKEIENFFKIYLLYSRNFSNVITDKK